MATYLVLGNFTDQGIRNVKDSPKRANDFKTMAEGLGVKVEGLYWATGNHDVVVLLSGSEEAVASSLLSVAALGNIRTQTHRLYVSDEMTGLIQAMA